MPELFAVSVLQQGLLATTTSKYTCSTNLAGLWVVSLYTLAARRMVTCTLDRLNAVEYLADATCDDRMIVSDEGQ